jgi:lipopolysaccharide/colanic/teichoic acid biosynthesis glycosyltransferase
MNVLFVCTENRARSPLAEALFRELQGVNGAHHARSAGIAPHAPRRLTTRELAWADLVAVMEKEHLAVIRRYWPGHARKVVVLDVSDHFAPEESALREALEPKVRDVLGRCHGGLVARRPRRPAKRVFDIALAGLGLLASAPLWGLIALAVRLEDGGPVFFAQERVGQGGRRFRGLKFRSMVADADRRFGPRQAGEADPRVTRVGRWLRATAMDELPQLWNIVRGDMSVVGPRALMPAEIEVNGRGEAVPLEAIAGYAERHLVRPGLTGLAQIYADRDIPRRHKFRYDRLYIRRQSVWLDLRLVALSFWITLRGTWERRGRKF